MKRPQSLLAIIACSLFPLSAGAAIEFLYTIKEQAFSQVGNTAPTTPTEWYFGAGASGDAGLTAFSITVPETANPIVVPGEPGEFDLETEAFASQAALDAAYPNGNFTLSPTDGGVTEDYGPFAITGDSYPLAPHFTNAIEFQDHDHSQDFTITWNTFAGADAADQIILQLWNSDTDDELIFEFLDPTTTSFVIPGGTLTANGFYELYLIFANDAGGVESPATIIGYISSTYFEIDTSTGGGSGPGIDFLFTVKEVSYRQIGNAAPDSPYEWVFAAGVNGGANVTGGSLTYPGGSGDFFGFDGSYSLGDYEFSSQAELDAAFPNGSYSLDVTVDGASQALGPFDLSGDGYPAAPQILNAVELQAHDPSQNFTLMWSPFAGADENDRVLIEVSDETNGGELVFEFLPASATSYEFTGGSFSEDRQYEIDIFFVNETDGLDEPDTIIGYLASTKITLSTVTSDTELRFYKWQRNLQTGTDAVQADGYRPFARVEGISNSVSYAEISTPASTYPLSMVGANTFSLTEPFTTKEQLDSAYPAGDYHFGLIENDSFIRYLPYQLPPDAYPQPPLFQNFSELQTFDATQAQSVSWNTPTAGVEDVDVFILTEAGALVWFENLSPDTPTIQIPGDTLTQFSNYRLVLRFNSELAGSEQPDASLGYMTSTYMSFQTYPGDLDYSSWLTQFFTEEQLQDPDIVGEAADPDGDKLNNRFEFLARLNPVDRNSMLVYTFSEDPDARLAISPINSGINWEVRSSVDLQSWATVNSDFYQVVGNEIQIELIAFLPATFFQVVLSSVEP